MVCRQFIACTKYLSPLCPLLYFLFTTTCFLNSSAHLQHVIEFCLPAFESYATFWHKSEMQHINDIIKPSDYRQIFQFSLLKVKSIQVCFQCLNTKVMWLQHPFKKMYGNGRQLGTIAQIMNSYVSHTHSLLSL